jgi:hypothetical protein
MAWFNGFIESFPIVLRYGDNGLNGLRTCKCIPAIIEKKCPLVDSENYTSHHLRNILFHLRGFVTEMNEITKVS